MKTTAIHDKNAFVECIETLEQHIGLKAGTLDRKPHVKASMEKVWNSGNACQHGA